MKGVIVGKKHFISLFPGVTQYRQTSSKNLIEANALTLNVSRNQKVINN